MTTEEIEAIREIWIIFGVAGGFAMLVFCIIGTHAMWFSGKLLRDMAAADFESAIFRYRAQQPPPPPPLPEKPHGR